MKIFSPTLFTLLLIGIAGGSYAQSGLEETRVLAEQGDPIAQYELGEVYEFGEGVVQNDEEAFNWYLRAAEQELAEAQNRVGLAYQFGWYVLQSYNEAIRWYRLSAEQNYAPAQVYLGAMYLYGFGVEIDLFEVEKWFLRAANNNHPVGQYYLANLYNEKVSEGREKYELEALKWYQRAAEQGIAQAQNKIAVAYQNGIGRNQNYEAAEKWFRLAIDQNSPAAMSNLGSLYVTQGRYSEAEPLLRKAISLTTNAENEATYLYNLARLYFEQGLYVEAESTLLKSMAITEEIHGLSNLMIVGPLNSLGTLYAKLMRSEEAENMLLRAIEILQKNSSTDSQLLSDVLNNLSIVYMDQGNALESEKTIKESIELMKFQKNSDQSIGFATRLVNLARIYIKEQRMVEALPLIIESLELNKELLGENHDDVARGYHALGTIYSSDENMQSEAEVAFLQALKIREDNLGITHPDTMQTLYSLSAIKLWDKKFEESLLYIRKLTKGYRDRFTDIATRQKNRDDDEQDKLGGLLFLNMDLALSREQVGDRDSLKNEAFEVAQLIRSSFAGTAISQMSARFSSGSNEINNLVRMEQDLRAQKAVAEAQYAKYIERGIRNRRSEPLDEIIKNISNKLTSVEEVLKKEYPQYLDLLGVGSISIEETQYLLDEKEAVFLVSEEKIGAAGTTVYAFLIGKYFSEAYKVEFDGAGLDEIVELLRDGLKFNGNNPLPNFNTETSYYLHEKLFNPVSKYLDDINHLMFVANTQLESLPLSVLVTEKPSKSRGKNNQNNLDYRDSSWLLNKFAITTLPSVTSLRLLRENIVISQNTSLFVGIGDPVLGAKISNLRGLEIVNSLPGGAIATTDVRKLPELPETSEELKKIARYLGIGEENLFLRERATEKNIKSLDLSKSQIIAFATHGLIGSDFPGLKESALVLTPPDNPTELDDGLLTASEIARLDLNADLVILSACNTASGDKLGAPGLSGLARAFIYAGARSLLVSHWEVETNSSARITTGIFEILQKMPGLSRAEALKRSMMALASDQNDFSYSHPIYWAPFSLIGEGQF